MSILTLAGLERTLGWYDKSLASVFFLTRMMEVPLGFAGFMRLSHLPASSGRQV